jgi:transcriptional regulator with XRE-family HTH domain
MTAGTIRMVRMSPRGRKKLDPTKLNERFGAHFQGLMEAAGLTVTELRKRLAVKGHDFSDSGVRKWMRGDAYPSPEAMISLASIFGLPDYRFVLPYADPRPRKK